MEHQGATMRRWTILGLAALALLLAGGAGAQELGAMAGKQLKGDAIAAALAGGTLKGVNSYGNPYTVRVLADGSLDGVAGKNGEYTDKGHWRVEGDRFCRQWQTWLDGKEDCFLVVLDGTQVAWFRPDGSFATAEELSR
jgi:GntR family transcriptional regulator/MocR family aminotransferase